MHALMCTCSVLRGQYLQQADAEDTVLDLLERLPPGPLYKEDGQLLIDTDGNRVA